MLTHFAVTNYKNFKDRIEFDMTNNNQCNGPLLIYGANGTGKTNLAQAIFDIRFLVSSEDNRLMSICANANSHVQSMLFEYTFKIGEHIVKYRYERDDDYVFYYERFVIDSQVLFEYHLQNRKAVFSAFNDNYVSQFAVDSYIANSSGTLSFLKYILVGTLIGSDAIISEFIGELRGMFLMYGSFGKLNRERFVKSLASNTQLLSQFKDFIASLGFKEPLCIIGYSSEPVLAIEYAKPLPFFDYASAGLQSAAKLFYTLYCRVNPLRFVFIDEFDATYHYQLAKTVLSNLEKLKGVQIVLTTHNIALLNITNYTNIAILEEGKILPIADKTNRDLSLGFNLEQLYRAGEFDET